MLRVNKIKRDELTATDIYLSIYSQTLLIMVLYKYIFKNFLQAKQPVHK